MGLVASMIKFAMHAYQEDLIPIQSHLTSLLPLWGISLLESK